MKAAISRVCPLCGGNAAEVYLQKKDLCLVRCRLCSMVYANPIPAEMATGAFYDEEASSYYLSPAKLESDYAPVRFQRELKVFRRFCRSGDVLDVGCSTGAFLYQLQQRFPGSYSIAGTDISGAPLDYAEQKGISICRGDFLTEDFGGQKFDAITFWAVMEHLSAPEIFLNKAAELLKPGGHCFILVPNLDSLAVRLLKGKYRYILPQHLNYFSRQTLRRFAGKSFDVQALCSMHFNPLVILQDFKNDGEMVPEMERAALLKRTTGFKQNPWLKPAKAIYHLVEKLMSPLGLCDNLVMVLKRK